MLIIRSAVSILLPAMMVLSLGNASGQAYPNKPIRVLTSEVGGGTDFATRIIVPGVSSALGQTMIVDNRNSILAAEATSKALPDGYTLLFAASPLWLVPLVQKTPYDPVRDFSPIALVTKASQILTIHPSVPANSVKEFIAVAKARPGALNYYSAGTGTPNHLGTELFKAMAGVDLVQVSYKGAALANNDLLSGAVQVRLGVPSGIMPFVKAGKLKALAVTSLEPSALFPELPPIAATLPGFEWVSYITIVAPAKTPATIINLLNQETVRVLQQADVKEKLFNGGLEAVGSSSGEFAAKMKSEMARMGKVIKDAGIRAD